MVEAVADVVGVVVHEGVAERVGDGVGEDEGVELEVGVARVQSTTRSSYCTVVPAI